MEVFQEKAWKCLTEPERKILFLTFSQGLSGRRAEEIMGLTHYKYLENKARAERLFKLFSEYFFKHPSLIDPKTKIEPRFRDYLHSAILNRKSKRDAIVDCGDSSWFLTEISSEKMCKNMQRLKDSPPGTWDRDLYGLVVEFDRWNNFRILPKRYQAPSAFNRRSQKSFRSYIKYLHRIPDSTVRALVDQYWSTSVKIETRYYLSLLSPSFPLGYIVVPIKKDGGILSKFTSMRVYIFNTPEEADEFGLLLYQYYERTLERADSLVYWREFRTMIQKAINYRYLSNLDFSYNALDQAFGLKRRDILHPPKVKKSKKKQKDVAK